MAMGSEHSWLLDPTLLKLVHTCRRLIQSEFGVRLRLTDDDIEQRLAEFAGKSRSPDLIKAWETLAPQIPGLDLPEPESPPEKTTESRSRRVYRGQVIE